MMGSPAFGEVTEPKFIGSYEIQEEHVLGQGTFGTVFKAFDTKNGQQCAIKRQKKHNHIGFKEMHREARVLRTLGMTGKMGKHKIGGHDNVIKLIEFISRADEVILVLEYMAGGSLKDYLEELSKRGERLSLETSRFFLTQIFDGMSYIWDRMYLHRDLKPGNVLLSEKSPRARLVIADFGSCTEIGLDQSLRGTGPYIAPEAIKSGYTHHDKADIYSLGVLAFQMLTGEKFVDPGAYEEYIRKGRSDAFLFARFAAKRKGQVEIPETGSVLPVCAKSMLQGMLASNPTKRWSRIQLMSPTSNSFLYGGDQLRFAVNEWGRAIEALIKHADVLFKKWPTYDFSKHESSQSSVKLSLRDQYASEIGMLYIIAIRMMEKLSKQRPSEIEDIKKIGRKLLSRAKFLIGHYDSSGDGFDLKHHAGQAKLLLSRQVNRKSCDQAQVTLLNRVIKFIDEMISPLQEVVDPTSSTKKIDACIDGQQATNIDVPSDSVAGGTAEESRTYSICSPERNVGDFKVDKIYNSLPQTNIKHCPECTFHNNKYRITCEVCNSLLPHGNT